MSPLHSAITGLIISTALVAVSASAQDQTLLLSQPDVSGNQIAFVYAGDIWIADRDGAHPQRHTSHLANEGFVKFSPDGKMLAFTARYDGNSDVYLPNTAGAGYAYFNRMMFAQTGRDAMIFDERSNGGGQAANYIIDVLRRVYLSGWKDRDGKVYNTPGGAIYGPKVMLIDQDAGSGGDYMPYAFRYTKIGKLIGTRTWGGLIGISANPQLIGGGFLTVPFFRFFTPGGEWCVENEGAAPDIEVALDPIAFNQGRDAQLERALADVMKDLRTYQPVDRKRPGGHNHGTRGLLHTGALGAMRVKPEL